MSAKCGSCFAARMLLATAWAFTPQSPPDTNVNVSVAFAGIVRKRYTRRWPSTWKAYSVPGVRFVNSAR